MKYKLKFGKLILSILLRKDAFFIIIIPFLLSYNIKAFSQEKYTGYSLKELQVSIFDSTIKKDSITREFKMTKSPVKAIIYSALLPGAGQFYNKSYWKIPVIWAIGGYLIYEVVRNNNKFLDYRDLYIASQSEGNPNGDTRYKILRENYRDQRDQFILYGVLLYLVNIFDAYVDAHLFDFDVSDKIKISGTKSMDKLLYLNINF